MNRYFFIAFPIFISLAYIQIDNYLKKKQLLSLKEELVSLMIVNDAYKDNKKLDFIRLGKDYDGGYVVPILALENTDILVGYGIRDDISLEEGFSNLYKKPSYGFDCGSEVKISPKNKLFTFIDECIGTDSTVESSMNGSNGKFLNFNQQLKKYDLLNQKLFIKMDIEGGEYYSLEEVISNSKTITGLAIEFHIFNSNQDLFQKTINLMKKLNENFVLVHIHGCNCMAGDGYLHFQTTKTEGNVPLVFEATYINKLLVDRYEVSRDQTFPKAIDMPCDKNKKDVIFKILTLKVNKLKQ